MLPRQSVHHHTTGCTCVGCAPVLPLLSHLPPSTPRPAMRTHNILLLVYLPVVIPSTHWVVTETGKVEAQLDSLFQLQQPHNFVAFLHQEQRAQDIAGIHDKLTSFRGKFDQNPDIEEPDIEAEVYKNDPNCQVAGKPLTQFDLFVSTNVRVQSPQIDKIFEKKVKSNAVLLEPKCSKLKPLKFTVEIDNIVSVADRKSLSMQGEVGLVANVLREGALQLAHYGHLVAHQLSTDRTNWVMYNMAANYWRIKGNAPEAIECLRKCLLHGPTEARSISVPLVSLGNILHHSQRTEDAAKLLEMAIDHDPQNSVSHYTLGNIYAALMHYNKSVSSFIYAQRLSPDLPWIEKRLAAVQCHQRLERSLEDQHLQLQATLKELRQYQSEHALWTKLNNKMKDEQASLEKRVSSRIEYERYKLMINGKNNNDQSCFETTENGKKVIQCVVNSKSTFKKTEKKKQASKSINLASTAQNKKDNSRKKPFGPENKPEDYIESIQLLDNNIPTRPAKYPKYEDPNVINVGEYEESSWPSQEDCKTHVSQFPDWAHLPTVYLPPENKGFDIAKIVTDDIDLKPGEAHPLPWYPPICEISNVQIPTKYGNLAGSKPAAGRSKFPDDNIKAQFLQSMGSVEDNVENVNIAEIGARIKSAIAADIWPKWLTFTMAATYWRVVGNAAAGIDCYLVALTHVPEKYRDVILTNLGALFYRTGNIDPALTLLQEAVSVCDTEPETHFFLANLYSAKGNMSGSIQHHRAALKLEPSFPGGLDQLRIPSCYVKYHSSSNSGSSSEEKCDCKSKDSENNKNDESGSCGQSQAGASFIPMLQKNSGEINAERLNRNSLTSIQGTDDYILCREGHCEFVTQMDVDSMYGDIKKGEKCVEAPRNPHIVLSKPINEPSCPLGTTPGLVVDTVPATSGPNSGNIHLIHRNEIGELPSGAVEIATIAETIDVVENNHGMLNVDDDPLPDIMIKVKHKFKVSNPTLSECESHKPVNWKSFTSTWLSVTAKKIDLGDALPEPAQSNHMDPICQETPVSMKSLDHLAGIKHRHHMKYIAEVGLKEAFKQLTGSKLETVSQMATRIARGLREDPMSWVLSTAAALYWRVKGDALKAITCLRHALYHAPHQMRDIPLVSLANIFHRAGLYNDALITTNMALEISPKFVVIHFTMANIYASKRDLHMAKKFYKSTLTLQSTFEPAYTRLISILCNQLK